MIALVLFAQLWSKRKWSLGEEVLFSLSFSFTESLLNTLFVGVRV